MDASSVQRQRRCLIESLRHRPKNAKRRRNQRAESALQLASQFHRYLALNRAFSANTHLDDAKALAVPQATGDMRFIGNPLQKDCLCHTA